MAGKARFSIRRLTGNDVCGPQLEALLWVFAAALGLSLKSTRVLAFGSSLKRHRVQPGFLAYGAFNVRDKLVGFTYGYSSQPGLWWREQITPLLTQHQRAEWLADTFELAELHVHPVAQGHGLGGRLLDRVMTRQPHPLGLLSVMHRSQRARALYASRGWSTLIPEMRFVTEPLEPFSILGWRRPSGRTPRCTLETPADEPRWAEVAGGQTSATVSAPRSAAAETPGDKGYRPCSWASD